MILTWYSSTYTIPSPLTWAGLCDCSKVTGCHFGYKGAMASVYALYEPLLWGSKLPGV